ncbi:MAG: hypothetical protein GYB65_14285 [Chloroflexi bacterium]|nr:hypothetical protein [Chloroflexota bacterium]
MSNHDDSTSDFDVLRRLIEHLEPDRASGLPAMHERLTALLTALQHQWPDITTLEVFLQGSADTYHRQASVGVKPNNSDDLVPESPAARAIQQHQPVLPPADEQPAR